MTNLVASMIVSDETDRYLRIVLDHLLEFCDSVRILDDGSTDGFQEPDWYGDDRVQVTRTNQSLFFEHEGRARQALWEWTLEAEPSHVITIDADEVVSDGHAVREACERGRIQVAALRLIEIWSATRAGMMAREDGGWKRKNVPFVFAVPARMNSYQWRVRDSASACPREPKAVAAMRNRARQPIADLLHLGWANVADRQARYSRYADRGNFGHQSAHIKSILFPDEKCELVPYAWPQGLEAYVDDIADRAQKGATGVLAMAGELPGGDVPPMSPRYEETIYDSKKKRWVSVEEWEAGKAERLAEAGLPGFDPSKGGVRIGEPAMIEPLSDDEPSRSTVSGSEEEIAGVKYAAVPMVLRDSAQATPGGGDFAVWRKHPDGRWIGVKWDGTIEHGRSNDV